MKKNDIYTINIEDMSNEGAGIGHIKTEEGGLFAVFVKDAVPGDCCEVQLTKVKKSYAFARLLRVVTPGTDRVKPLCPHAARCGGCAMMQLDYKAQLSLKQKKVEDCLTRLGGVENTPALMEEICGMETPYRYRNKMQFPVGLDKNGKVIIGFYAGRTHYIIDMEACPIGHAVNDYLIKALRPLLQKLQDETGTFIYNEEMHAGLLRHIVTRVGFTTGEFMVCFVVNGSRKSLPAGAEQKLMQAVLSAAEEYNKSIEDPEKQVVLKSVVLNSNTEKTNRILGEKCETLYGNAAIHDILLGNDYEISPLSFFQVNPVQTARLYQKAIDYAGLSGKETVWDLYCGIGTISLSLSDRAAKVYGVEIVPQAIENAKENAARNNISNAEFFCGSAETLIPHLHSEDPRFTHADVVIVDPPRKGCDPTLLTTILNMAPDRVVYVSCDPATLARDIKILSEKYTLTRAKAFDQFCHSMHVETVVLLNNKFAKAKDFVQIGIDAEDYYRIKDAKSNE